MVVHDQPATPSDTLAEKPPEAADAVDATLDTLGMGRTTRRPQSAGEPAPGPKLRGYQVLGELGRGGMGVVYKAQDLGLNRVVALKMILSGEFANEAELERFRLEAEAIAKLQHPNIVQVFDIDEHDGRPYFSLEFVDGGALDKRLAGDPLPARQAARLAEQLARAMGFAHERGILHRDLKPANVLVTGAGVPKITDFGLAKKMDDRSGRTRSGAIMGTPSYMAPEQALGQEVGAAADIYSLGAILYELTTGRPPFKGATVLDTLEQVRSQEPVPPCRLQPKIPRDLETVCLKCLAKDPRQRYATAEELADDLNRFLEGEPIRARPVPVWERAWKWGRRQPTAAALVVVSVLGLFGLGVAGLLFERSQRVEQRRLAETRAEIQDLRAQGQAAARSLQWKQAEVLLDRAMEKIDADPALADLRASVAEQRDPVKRRLAALDTLRRFSEDRDKALFHATLAGGENFQTNRAEARSRAEAALAAVGLTAEGVGSPTTPGLTPEEQAEVATGCHALLMMLAETEARALPGQSPEDHARSVRHALTLLDRAAAIGKRARAIHLRRARYLTLLGDAAAAARETELARSEVVDTDPQDHFLVGHELYTRGDLDQAAAEFRRALQLDPRHFWTNYFLGISCISAGKPEVAVGHLTVCQSQQPKLVWIYLLRGFALGQMQDYPAAEADFDVALDLDSSPATRHVLFNNRGVMRVGQKGQWDRGVADLQRAAELLPDHYQAEASLAEAYRIVERFADAARHMDRAVTIAAAQVRAEQLPTETLALLHHSRARLALQRSDREAALTDLSEAVRLAGADRQLLARAEADRGRVLHLQGRFEEALGAYDAAVRADPGRAEVHRWLGEVYLFRKQYAEAGEAFTAFLDRGGARSTAVYRQRGLARAKLGLHAEAAEDFSRALEVTPKEKDRLSLYLARGQEYLAGKALELALRDFTEAGRIEPTSVEAHLGIAAVLARKGEDARAVAEAEAAVKNGPVEPRLLLGAARILALAADRTPRDPGLEGQRGRYQERAAALIREALDRLPEDGRSAFWRDHVRNDKSIVSLRRQLTDLAARYGGFGG